MTEIIRGAGGGGGGGNVQVNNTVVVNAVSSTQRAAITTADTLASKQYATFIDLLSEGEIEGFPSAKDYAQGTTNYNNAALKDIFLNGTSVVRQGANPAALNTYDYNYQGVTFYPRYGTQNQAAVNQAIEDEQTVGVGYIVRNGSNDYANYNLGTQRENDVRTKTIATGITNANTLIFSLNYAWSGDTAGTLYQQLRIYDAGNNLVASGTGYGVTGSFEVSLTGRSTSEVFYAVVESVSKSELNFRERTASGTLTWSFTNPTTTSQTVTRTVTDSNVDAVRVTITVPRLEVYTAAGDVLGSSVSLTIQVQYNGGGFNNVITDTIAGRTADSYQKDYLVNLSGAFPVDIRVVRNTADSTSGSVINDFYWSGYTEIIYEKLGYPNSALVGMTLDAEQFNSIPTRTYRIRGIKVAIPSNGTVDSNTGRIAYSGVWDGTFAAATWTTDPAWILWDLLTSTRYGFGDHIEASQLDKFAFFSASQYASALVPDGFGGQEPRFSCNCIIQNQDEAYTLINELCSVMRVMPYWATGTLTISQDKPTDTSYLFTLANVTEEGFTYSGSSIKTRHTVAVVSYFDMEAQELAYEVVEDRDGISKYGVVTATVKAFACTSRGQAARLGEWMLYSEQYETEVVTFTTSVDAGVLVRPGQVIEVADPVKAGVRRGGRINAATTTTVTVDDTAATDLVTTNNPTLSVVLPDGTVETKAVSGISGAVITVSSAFSAAPNANSVWILQNDSVQTSTWRVLSVEERDGIQYSVSALAYNASKYNYVERDQELQQRDITVINARPDTPTNLTASETLYEQGGKAFSKIIVSWKSVVGVNNYRIEWRRANGNWTTQMIQRADYEIEQNAADTYQIRVYSLNAILQTSTLPAELTYAAAGKTDPPEDPTGISIIPNSATTAILSWTRATDLDVLLGGKVIIRHNTLVSGADWEDSNDIVSAAAGSQTQKQVPLLEGTYQIKFEDDTGHRSTNAVSASVDLPTPQPRLLVQSYREDQETPPFSGNLTNMIYSSEFDGLILNVGTPIDDLATDGDFDALGSIDAQGGAQGSGEYEFGSTLDLDGVYDMVLRRYFVTRPYLPGELWDDNTANIDTWTSIDGNLLDDVNAVLFVRSTNDDPDGTPTWSDWREFANAITRGRAFQFKTVATSTNAAQNIIIDELGCELELDQRTESSAALTSGASTLSVTFNEPFYQAPSLGVTAFNMATGDFYEVASITRTGFQVTFKDSGSTPISRQFTYTAIGYGREII
jgi:predicted phage tail protein